MDKTSIIIPCYFADESFLFMTSACLASLKYGRPDQVILVNDGSPVEFEPNYRFIDDYCYSTENKGYAAAVNRGLLDAGGAVLIISNNDIIFTPGWLEAILKPLEMGYDISSIMTSDGGWTTENKITEGDKFGSLWAMKREVYDTIGGLDESFGNYFEDLDFQRRAELAGYKVAKNRGHLVEHMGRATFSVVDPDEEFYGIAGKRFFEKWNGKLDPETLKEDLSPDFEHLL